MLHVWVLYEEFGEYSSYSKGILGVFSDAELAKQWLEHDCKKIVANHPSNSSYGDRTDWELSEDDWHCHTRDERYGRNEWTIAHYMVDPLVNRMDGAEPRVVWLWDGDGYKKIIWKRWNGITQQWDTITEEEAALSSNAEAPPPQSLLSRT